MDFGTFALLAFIVAMIALIVFAVRYIIKDNKLKKNDPEAWTINQIMVHKNNPKKLRELGATEEQIVAAEKRQEEIDVAKAERKAQAQEKRDDNQYNAIGPGTSLSTLKGMTLKHKGKKFNIKGADVVLEIGHKRERVTLTRVVGGNMLLGGAGTIAGAMSKKDLTKGYIIVTCLDGTGTTIEFPVKEESKARQFSQALSNASAYYANKHA